MFLNAIRRKYNKEFVHLLWITIAYVAAHWFLIVATGKWWDDWIYADKDWQYLLEVFLQSSLPFHAFIDASTWLFPDGFYRILTFVFFYVGGILYYLILKKIDFISYEAKFWIVMLYMVTPLYDARIIWICYGYSFGLFMFWIAFYLCTLWRGYNGVKRIIVRIISLIILMISFDTESIMLLTPLILLYFYYDELKTDWNWKTIKVNVKKIVIAIVHHLDYLLAPVIWYVGDKLLFPGYGRYEGHSYIRWDDLPEIVWNSGKNAMTTFGEILSNYRIQVLNSKTVQIAVTVVILAFLVFSFFWRKKTTKGNELKESYLKDFGMVFLGALIFFLAFFPYAVKRNSAVSTTWVGGRDSVLLGIGTSILIYYGLHLIFRKVISRVIMVAFVVMGIMHFNYWYLEWQEKYYQQLELQSFISQNEEIKEDHTILAEYNGGNGGGFEDYVMNGNAYQVTGEETRYFIPYVESIPDWLTMDADTWYVNGFCMKDYDHSNKTIDGILFIELSDIDRRTVLQQKWNELFNTEAFVSWLDEITNIKYVPISKKDSDWLIQQSTDNVFFNNYMIYDMFYNETE